MSNRPTPETDAEHAQFKMGGFTLDFCRKLERERDEAREHLAAIKHYLTKERDDALAQIVQAECRAERFCQERDELLAYLDAAHYATCNAELRRKLDKAQQALRDIAEANHFDNIGNWARNKAKNEITK